MKFFLRGRFGKLILALIILVFLFLTFLFLQRNYKFNPQNDSNISLEVSLLKTNYGISGITPRPCPPIATALVPDNLASQLSAYCVAEEITIIGPKSWNGEAHIGADGSMFVSLYPGNEFEKSKSYLKVSEIPGCVSCALGTAAIYFEEAKDLYAEDILSLPKVPQGLEVNPVSSSLVRYSLPKLASGLTSKGIAYFKMTDSQPYFIKMELAMYEEQTELLDFLLNTFVTREKLK